MRAERPGRTIERRTFLAARAHQFVFPQVMLEAIVGEGPVRHELISSRKCERRKFVRYRRRYGSGPGLIDLALAAELAEIDLETLYNYNPAFNRWATDPDGPHSLLLPANSAEIFEENYLSLPADKHLRWSRHKVKSGETLSHIALKYNTSVKHLRSVNDIRGNNIRQGKYLLIPVSSKDKSSYALSSAQRLKTTQSKKRGNGKRITHTVQNGESFWEISRKYKVNMHSLAKWNGMAIRDPLKKGQKLVVWSNSKSTVASKKSGQTHNPNSTIKSIHYTVRNGDSLSRIASKYRVDVKDLHRWNTIKGKYIKPGQRLKLYIDVTEQSSSQS